LKRTYKISIIHNQVLSKALERQYYGLCTGDIVGIDSQIGEQEKDLFIRIFRQLGQYKDPYQSISGILEDTCNFFGFYSGFVYEADHAQVFHLCEQFFRDGLKLKERFLLADYLSPQDIEGLIKKTGEIVYLNSRKNSLGSKFLELFSAQTLIMIPVIFENATPIAFVGLMDRRRPIRLSKREIGDADAILSVLAGHIKMRVYQKRLEYAYSSMKSIIDKAGVDIYVSDYYTCEILFVNESMAAVHGGIDMLLGKLCWQVLYPGRVDECDFCPRKRLLDSQGNPFNVYTWNFRRPQDGAWFRAISAAFRWVDGRLAHVVSSIDISENKRNEMLVRKMADSDSLTSLQNRRKFIVDLNESLERMKKNGYRGYLLFMDLDDFKVINDTLGHLAGDDLLYQISQFLSSNESILGIPYRYGGDEFVLLAENKTEEDLRKIQEMLLDRFARGWVLEGKSIFCKASIGAVAYPEGDKTDDDLIGAADMAMYEVKKSGKHGFHLALKA
jgi:diguanylate cyclase (GGDEF)-like protein